MIAWPLLLWWALAVLAGCQSAAEAEAATEINFEPAAESSVAVRVAMATEAPFPRTLEVNGTLRAGREVRLRSRTNGLVVRAPQEGAVYEAGELLLRMDTTDLWYELQFARIQYEEALLEKDELLIQMGGLAGVDSSVSTRHLEAINLQSGFKLAQWRVQTAERNLRQASLYAPFSGVMADVKVHPHQEISAGETIGSLIDPNSLEAVFSVLELEWPHLRSGQAVLVSPLGAEDVTIAANIAVLNPKVDEHGLIRVVAPLTGPYAGLITGMHVKVVVTLPAEKAVIVPKAALVRRAERDLVFVYNAEKRVAEWRYVSIAAENDEVAALAEGLRAGERVIVEGNLTLSHLSPVHLVDHNN